MAWLTEWSPKGTPITSGLAQKFCVPMLCCGTNGLERKNEGVAYAVFAWGVETALCILKTAITRPVGCEESRDCLQNLEWQEKVNMEWLFAFLITQEPNATS